MVETLDEIDLSSDRQPGDPVSCIKIPKQVISDYKWVERGMVKEVSFKQQTVAVTNDGETISQKVHNEKGYDDNYSDVQSKSIVGDRLSQDQTDIESSQIDTSSVVLRDEQEVNPDLKLAEKLKGTASKPSSKPGKSSKSSKSSKETDSVESALQDQLNNSDDSNDDS